METLLVADIRGYVFHNIYSNLSRCFGEHVHLRATYGRSTGYVIEHQNYDSVLWMVDVRPDKLIKAKIPRGKVCLAIRSEVFSNPSLSWFYKNPTKVNEICSLVLAPNRRVYEIAKNLYANVEYFPGGVNDDLFLYSNPTQEKREIVGWAGSVKYHGDGIKRVKIVKRLCDSLSLKFAPAVFEKLHYSQQQMADIYYPGIGIYVDYSSRAGRQNGVLEAGCCGRIVIASSGVGITDEIIENGVNGFSVKNNAELKVAMVEAKKLFVGEKLRESIIRNGFTWKEQASNLEKILLKNFKYNRMKETGIGKAIAE